MIHRTAYRFVFNFVRSKPCRNIGNRVVPVQFFLNFLILTTFQCNFIIVLELQHVCTLCAGLGNHRMDLEKTFDELDADELSSDGLSSPALLLQDDRPQDCGDDSCDGPALEPGLTSKPPIPPVVGNGHAASPDSSFGHRTAAVTFDDAIELKFQRWFPNSAPIAPAAVPSEGTADVSLNGVSYEYSERVIDNDRGTVTYTRSSSSMSIRGSQDQLDEEHLYSNLSAAIGGADKLCRGSVSVDMLEILQNDDNRRAGAPARPKPKKKKTPAPAAVAPKVKRDAPKSVLKSRTNAAVTAVTCKTEPSDGETVRHEHQQAPEKEARKDNPSRKPDDSPVDYATEDVVSWMSSHQLRSSTSELDDPFISRVDDKHCVFIFFFYRHLIYIYIYIIYTSII